MRRRRQARRVRRSPAAQEEAAKRTAASAELEAELARARATVMEEQGSVQAERPKVVGCAV